VIRWRSGEVIAVRKEWAGAVELDVTAETGSLRALAYPALTGRPRPGDRVLLNVSALELGLGTGGYALVVAIPDRLPADPSGPEHLVKARYTPLQAIVPGADEQGSEHHEMLREADDLGGVPVVIANQMPDVAPGSTPVAFGDWRAAYLLVNRRALTILPDPYSAGWCVLYRLFARFGGGIICADAARLLRIK